MKEIVESEDPEGSNTGLLFSWVSETNLLNALGVELPDAMKDIDSKARKIVTLISSYINSVAYNE